MRETKKGRIFPVMKWMAAWACLCSVEAGLAEEMIWQSKGSNNWENGSNWSADRVPGPGDVSVFDARSETWAGPAGGKHLEVGAILVKGERTGPAAIQPFKNAGTASTLTLAGASLPVGGKTETVLLSNKSQQPLTISNREEGLGLQIELGASGVVEADGTIAVGSPITGEHSITKRGGGLLLIGDEFTSSTNGGGNTFTGDFVLEDGELATYASSSYRKQQLTASPFGLGKLVLKGGVLRSTSGNPRTYLNAVEMQGSVTFGGSGPIAFGPRTGGETTLKGDVTLHVNNMSTTLGQLTKGDGRLTKEGKGQLVISGDVTVKELIVKTGGLRVLGSLTCERLEIGEGGSLSGSGKINSPEVINPSGVHESEFTLNHLGQEITVLVYRPEGYEGKSAVVLLHGASRDASGYRKSAAVLANKLKMLLVVPEFDRTRFDPEAYQEGGVLKKGEVNSPENWTFTYMAPLLEEVTKREGKELSYYLVGHSGGAQFLDRMAAFLPGSPSRIVAVNPGSLIFPTRDQPYPYGFGGLPESLSSDDAIKAYLAAPLTLYLGTGDVTMDALPVGGDAMRQGATRIERGRNCYAAAKALAESRGWPFNWKIVEAEGLGHGSLAMWKHEHAEQAVIGQ